MRNPLRSVEAAAKHVGIAASLGIMIIIVADVAMRYVLNSPIAWAYDLISMFLIPLMFFIPLSYVQRRHGNIAVDLLIQHAPDRLRNFAFRICAASGAAVYGVVAWIFLEKGWKSYLAGEEIIGPNVWTVWPMYAIVGVGFLLLLLRLLAQIFQDPASLAHEAGHEEPLE